MGIFDKKNYIVNNGIRNCKRNVG